MAQLLVLVSLTDPCAMHVCVCVCVCVVVAGHRFLAVLHGAVEPLAAAVLAYSTLNQALMWWRRDRRVGGVDLEAPVGLNMAASSYATDDPLRNLLTTEAPTSRGRGDGYSSYRQDA